MLHPLGDRPNQIVLFRARVWPVGRGKGAIPVVEILRCPDCGFRIRGFPAQYLNRRVVECPQCRTVTPISVEDRLRLKRLLVEEGETAAHQARGREAA